MCTARLQLRLNLPAPPALRNPLIDLSPIYSDLTARQALTARIRDAAENTGFFYIKNHGIPASVIAEAQRQAEAFFHQPDSEREVVSKEKSKYFNGWSARRTVHASPSESLDYREAFGWRYAPQYDPQGRDPDAVPKEVKPYIRGEEFV